MQVARRFAGRVASTRSRDVLWGIGLFLGSVLLYLPATRFGFVSWDDGTILLHHPTLYNQQSLSRSLYEIIYGYFPREEPLLVRDVTWAIDSRLFGIANPFGYHLGNVFWNGVNVALAFSFVLLTTRRYRDAAVVASMFAVSPVHVEPTAWVMGRKDLLASALMLLALIMQTIELRSTDRARRRAAFLVTLLLAALAPLAKFGAIVLFLVLGLHRALFPFLTGERAPHERVDGASALRAATPILVAAGMVSAGVFVWYRTVLMDYQILQGRGPGLFTWEHVLTLARFVPLTLGLYLLHFTWPYELSVNYPFPSVNVPVAPWVFAVSAAIAVALVVGTWWLVVHRKDLAFYALAALVSLLPYVNIVYIGTWLADRYFYFASFFVTALAVTAASTWSRGGGRWRRQLARSVFVVMLGWFGARSFEHQFVWRDDHALWRYEASRAYPSVLAFSALAQNLARQARDAPSLVERERLFRLARDTANRGIRRYAELGVRTSSYATNEQFHLAALHAVLGDITGWQGASASEQVVHYERAFRIDSGDSNAIRLSRAYMIAAAQAPPEQQEVLVRKSLQAFLRYLDRVRHDVFRLRDALRMLDANYARQFSFLAPEVRRAREMYDPERGMEHAP